MKYNSVLSSIADKFCLSQDNLSTPLEAQDISRYLTYLRTTIESQNTYRNARSILNRFFSYLAATQTLRLGDITPALLQGFLQAFTNPNYRYNAQFHVQNFLDYAGLSGDTNPARHIKKPRLRPGTKRKFLTPTELQQLQEELSYRLSKGQNLREYVLLQVLAFSGRRISDVLLLRKTDVCSDGTMYFTDQKGKQALIRQVPPIVIESIRTYHETQPSDSPYVFYPLELGPVPNQPLSYSAVYAQLRRILKSAGIHDMRQAFHSLRHTFSYSLQQAGFEEDGIRQSLGQQSLTAVKWYTQQQQLDELTNMQMQSAIKRYFGTSLSFPLARLLPPHS